MGAEDIHPEAAKVEMRELEVRHKRVAAERAADRYAEGPLPATEVLQSMREDGYGELADVLWQSVNERTRGIEDAEERAGTRDELVAAAELVFHATRTEERLNETSRGELFGDS